MKLTLEPVYKDLNDLIVQLKRFSPGDYIPGRMPKGYIAVRCDDHNIWMNIYGHEGPLDWSLTRTRKRAFEHARFLRSENETNT